MRGVDYRIDAAQSWHASRRPTKPPPEAPDANACREALTELSEEIADWQERLYAEAQQALLVIFQGLDASGKDSTIRSVFRRVSPAGCPVTSFKEPSREELLHDFLWRSNDHLPARGEIAVFNRSYYESVLTVRVHPELLQAEGQKLHRGLWAQRLEAICAHEQHLHHQGTRVIKFWLHVSKSEQLRRIRSRLDNPDKHWKFSCSDIHELAFRRAYLQAYEAAIRTTTTAQSPWYVVPADSKPYLQLCVAEALLQHLREMNPRYPKLSRAREAELSRLRKQLERLR